MPILREYQFNEVRSNQALEGIYSTVVLRDILQRTSQTDQNMQVTETRERELRPLRMIRDNYEKIILSMDRNYINSYDGIKSLYLIDWLLS